MPKSLSSLWLSGIKRMGRAQQAQQAQGRKFFLSLLPSSPAPAPAKRRRVKPTTLKLVALKALKLIQTAKPVAKTRVRKPLAVKAPLEKPPLPAATHPLPGSWQRLNFSGGEGTYARSMAYWLYVPTRAPIGAGVAHASPMPLVVMLHGCEQSVSDFATSTRMNELAQRKGFAVLYPEQSASADAHRCWHWYKRPTQEGFGDVRLIAHMIAAVQAGHDLDASRTYVAGLSAGAGLASILALRHPELVAAVGLHSAPVFGTSDSTLGAYGVMQHGSALAHSDVAHALVKEAPAFPGMPVILIHGVADEVVRSINAQQLAGQFAIVNAPLLTSADGVKRKFPARSGGRAPHHGFRTTTWYAGRKPQIVKCEIEGLGHAWSGGDGSVPYSAPAGPDATLLMWTFFARHQRVALTAPQAITEITEITKITKA